MHEKRSPCTDDANSARAARQRKSALPACLLRARYNSRSALFQAGYTHAMYTQCPHCLSVFVIEAERVGSARGHVRCGQCTALFDALPTLCDELPPEPYVTLPRQDGTAPAPQLDALMTPPELPAALAAAAHAAAESAAQMPVPPAPAAVLVQDTPQVVGLMPRSDGGDAGAELAAAPDSHADADTARAFAPTSEPTAPAAAGSAAHDAAIVDAIARAMPAQLADGAVPVAAPEFARHRRRGTRWLWRLLALLLTLGLGAQLVWIERAALTQNALTRPWLRRACQILHVPPPQVRDLALLQLGARDIRPHPEVPGALLISATLHNRAPWTQPYPQLEVSLSDLSGKPVAQRVFAPDAYLGSAVLAARGLPAGASAAISLEVHDPGRQAVAFAIHAR
ncbi:zinc-ribbon and DUF3426 domain-containing protein [Metallibacterium scheffleri]|uniref:Zinc finger/thioredoxin putative domain-containing protein n=1 Tax=Metallibacterium scheffleri TaxID=993689 RepID=A0A4S3KL32_9GAMM|nr:zinc-ribbon and DUF3426 domain-containing protein [Metallibacterium scheffleri]THD09400.1 hypothetical protein B1806_11030 [Metallibacterium scheffleri]